jgi:predicted nuclease of predicted toxin-antitoxin system
MAGRPRIPFFTDQCVPDSVGKKLAGEGHAVTRLRDCMASDTADPVIAVACAEAGQVLVSHDHDFRALAKRLRITQRQYQKSLHRVDLRCEEPKSAQRILEALAIIEAEWERAGPGKPMVIEVRDRSIVVHR